jgi:hypothetical protein
MWQETRDAANWSFQSAMTGIDAQTRLSIAAMGNEALKDTATQKVLIDAGGLAIKLYQGISGG